MNHELNMQIAQEVTRLKGAGIPAGNTIPGYLGEDGWWRGLPDYSGSLDAAWQMEDEIERRGGRPLQDAYVVALRNILWPSILVIPYLWDIIHATPEQRCRAALEAVREKT